MTDNSNVTILVHEGDNAPYRMCYMYMHFLPRVGEKIYLVPHGEMIQPYEVIEIDHGVFTKFQEGWTNYKHMPSIHVKEIENE